MVRVFRLFSQLVIDVLRFFFMGALKIPSGTLTILNIAIEHGPLSSLISRWLLKTLWCSAPTVPRDMHHRNRGLGHHRAQNHGLAAKRGRFWEHPYVFGKWLSKLTYSDYYWSFICLSKKKNDGFQPWKIARSQVGKMLDGPDRKKLMRW